MAGNKKPAKPALENMSKAELHKYYLEQMARAKKSLEEKTKSGDEKGMKLAAEIIQNIEGMISRL